MFLNMPASQSYCGNIQSFRKVWSNSESRTLVDLGGICILCIQLTFGHTLSKNHPSSVLFLQMTEAVHPSVCIFSFFNFSFGSHVIHIYYKMPQISCLTHSRHSVCIFYMKECHDLYYLQSGQARICCSNKNSEISLAYLQQKCTPCSSLALM